MIKIYTIPNCPYCNELKDILTNEGVEYKEIDVNLPENEEEWNKLHEVTKSDMVPIVLVEKQILVPNVSFKTIRECADITKKFLG
jgi:glutaredoxin